MIIIREAALSYIEWISKVAGQTFRHLSVSDREQVLSVTETGKFGVFPEHKNFDKGNLTVCSSKGPVASEVCVVIDEAERSIAKIESSGRGFSLKLRSGCKIHIFN